MNDMIRIYSEDIEDLENMVRMFAREKKFAKASECQKELEEIKVKLAKEIEKEKNKPLQHFEEDDEW